MNYSECIENARTRIGNYCKACPECNGRACKNQMPGPGAKGVGDTAIRNYDKWKEMMWHIMIFWYLPVQNTELLHLQEMAWTVM